MFEQFIQEIIDEMEKQGMIAQAKPGEKVEEKKPESEIPTPPPDVRKVWNDAVNTVEAEIEVKYDTSNGKYYIDGKEYSENTAVWMPLEYNYDFGCNLDPDQPLGSNFTPELIPFKSYLRRRYGKIHVEFIPPKDEFGFRRRGLLPNEADFAYALEHCTEHQEPGFFIFCRKGEFRILAESHYYFEENDQDYLICIFNARPCSSAYRKIWTTLELEVDAILLSCAIRYVPSEMIAWDDKTLAVLKEEAMKGDWFFNDAD